MNRPLRLSDLSKTEVRHRLLGAGLRLKTGPFVYSIRTPLDELSEAIYTLYADFPLPEEDGFADFHVAINPRHCLRLFAPRAATFSVEGQPNLNPFSLAMAIPHFEWGLNWCISTMAHDRLILHAATVERAGRALLILGISGSGKSTLAASLAADQWRLLSDEFALISTEDGSLTALARPVSLKNESIELIGRRIPDPVFGPTSVGEPKGRLCHLRPDRSWVDRVDESAKPASLLLLNYQPGAKTELRQTAKGATMVQVISHCFNYYLLGQQGFETLARTIDECECYQFTYSDIDDAVRTLGSIS